MVLERNVVYSNINSILLEDHAENEQITKFRVMQIESKIH